MLPHFWPQDNGRDPLRAAISILLVDPRVKRIPRSLSHELTQLREVPVLSDEGAYALVFRSKFM